MANIVLHTPVCRAAGELRFQVRSEFVFIRYLSCVMCAVPARMQKPRETDGVPCPFSMRLTLLLLSYGVATMQDSDAGQSRE